MNELTNDSSQMKIRIIGYILWVQENLEIEVQLWL